MAYILYKLFAHYNIILKSFVVAYRLVAEEITEIVERLVSHHNCSVILATTQLADGRSPLDVQRQLGHSSLKMTDHYASLSIQQLQKSHEQHSTLRAKKDNESEGYGSVYWTE